jgi:hypothetical protein
VRADAGHHLAPFFGSEDVGHMMEDSIRRDCVCA